MDTGQGLEQSRISRTFRRRYPSVYNGKKWITSLLSNILYVPEFRYSCLFSVTAADACGCKIVMDGGMVDFRTNFHRLILLVVELAISLDLQFVVLLVYLI
ncbi:hypothetical protein T03_15999 [Trichinella britovi]|uniref:Uncharacterized protein n=1 Tax=Trichinella britovi TaxID=45882 RepID=A0A0V1D8X8_TRIBR|nr:hypothetical protein T03_15999 [Trichinella britovi]